MNENISIQLKSIKYDIDREDCSIACIIRVSLHIFGEEKHFLGGGVSHCTKENIFNEEFGRALAGFRASQDIYRQIEISLVKYTFDHFVKGEFFTEGYLDSIIKMLRREHGRN